MPYVITEGCTKCMTCVEECPVSCIHEGTDMVYINPDECTECSTCNEVCPQEPPVPQHEDDVPDEMRGYIQMNRDFFELSDEEFEAKYGKPK
ncbi:MAG: 4Fe-4S binding protein [Armatimonadota bacterium]|nr:4Fe-4S binding protein [Armatimonadota bacterium]MDW8025358.1 4Fe-4S binding protein [Armatimonadota bacterium]